MTYCDRRLGGTERWSIARPKDYAMRIPEELLRSVVYLGLDGPDGEILKGTGFLVQLRGTVHKDSFWGNVVTADHVATALAGINFWIKVNGPEGRAVKIYRGDKPSKVIRWWRHPDETSKTDVAIHPIAIPPNFEMSAVPPDMFVRSIGGMEDDVGIGDEVIIVGLFSRASGAQRVTPIVRTGNLAMLPGEPIPTRAYGEITAYLVEARSIDGLSGSPVFIRETLQFSTTGPPAHSADNVRVSHTVGSMYLLGLMHGHWDVDPSDVNVPHPLHKEAKAGGVNVGIAVVVPAAKILETLYHPELAALRERFERTKLEQEGLPSPD